MKTQIVYIHFHSIALIVFDNNRSGQDAAKVAIKVLDRPAAPEAPMKTTVEGSVCNLLWKKVKEDGGSPIEHYQVRT